MCGQQMTIWWEKKILDKVKLNLISPRDKTKLPSFGA